MDWLEAVSKAVSEGRTNAQLAIPDGIYNGDMFFITNKEHKIITALVWSGERWITELEAMNIELPFLPKKLP